MAIAAPANGDGGGGSSSGGSSRQSDKAYCYRSVPSSQFSPVGGFMPQDWVVHSPSQWLGQVISLGLMLG